MRVVGKEGALGAWVGGNCRSGMDGLKTIIRRHPGRESVCYSGGFGYWVGRLSKKERIYHMCLEKRKIDLNSVGTNGTIELYVPPDAHTKTTHQL